MQQQLLGPIIWYLHYFFTPRICIIVVKLETRNFYLTCYLTNMHMYNIKSPACCFYFKQEKTSNSTPINEFSSKSSHAIRPTGLPSCTRHVLS